jgi:F-type H+-transporting ATPase subunit gamma
MATQNAKVLKTRIKSVKSIQRITKTMKMVAASKLRGFQGRMEQSRPATIALKNVINAIPDGEGASAGKEQLIVAITSDRGLCGGINSAIAKSAKLYMKEHTDTKFNVVCVGEKGKAVLQRIAPQSLTLTVGDATKKPPTFLLASTLAQEIIPIKFDSGKLMFNKFNTVISFSTTSEELVSGTSFASKLDKFREQFEFEGEESLVMSDLYEFQLAAKIFNSLLENATVEQSARMTAMDGASKNCGEMINRLTLSMNKARQATITKELCEIVAGAESVKGDK